MGDFPTSILLATDGSEGAELAASRAVELAKRTDSELHVVHVGQAPAFLTSNPGTRGYTTPCSTGRAATTTTACSSRR